MSRRYEKNEEFEGLTTAEFAHRHDLPVWKVRYLADRGRIVGVSRHPLSNKLYFNENARIIEPKVHW